MNITLLGNYFAKNVFQLHGVDRDDKAILKKRISRDKLPEFIANFTSCVITMETCSRDKWHIG